MALKWSDAKRRLFVLALALTMVIVQADSVVYPIINSVYLAFPSQEVMVNTWISISSLSLILSSLLVPVLLRFIDKRILLLVTCVVFGIVSIFGAAIDNIYYMVACRAIVGLCNGITMVVYIAFLSEVYIDEAMRGNMIGMFSGAACVVGSAMGVASGWLATTDWHLSFNVYLAAIPMLVMCAFFLPRQSDFVESSAEADSGEAGQSSEVGRANAGLGAAFWVIVVAFLLWNLVWGFYGYFVSTYIAENAIGDEALAGLISSVSGILGAVAGFAFGPAFKVLKDRLVLVCGATMAAAYVLLFALPSPTVAVAGAVLIGFSYTLYYNYVMTKIPELVPAQRMDSAFSIATACAYAGLFAVTYLVQGIAGALFGGVVTRTFLIGAGVGIAVSVLTLMGKTMARPQETAR